MVSPSDSNINPAAPSSAKCPFEKDTTSWLEYRMDKTAVGNPAVDFIYKSPKLLENSIWQIIMPGTVQGNQVKNNGISPSGLHEQSKLPQTLSQMTPRCPYRLISNSAAARTRRKWGALLETSQSKTNQRLGHHCQKAAFTSQESWSCSCLTCPSFAHIRWVYKWTY